MAWGRATHGEGVEALLARGVPDLVAQDAVFESAFLSEESGADCWLLVGLEVVRHLSTMSVTQRVES